MTIVLSARKRKATLLQPLAPHNEIAVAENATVVARVGKLAITTPLALEPAVAQVSIAQRRRRAELVQPPAPALKSNQIALKPGTNAVTGKVGITALRPIPEPVVIIVEQPTTAPHPSITQMPIAQRGRKATLEQPLAPELGRNQIALSANADATPLVGKTGVVSSRKKAEATEEKTGISVPFLPSVQSMRIAPAVRKATVIIDSKKIPFADESENGFSTVSETLRWLVWRAMTAKIAFDEKDNKYRALIDKANLDLRQEILAKISDLVQAIPEIHPLTGASASTNPALSVNEQTQRASLNLTVPGSYDNSASRAKSNSIQEAVDELFDLRRPSLEKDNRLQLDKNRLPYVPDLVVTHKPRKEKKVDYANGKLNIAPRVIGHLRWASDKTTVIAGKQPIVISERWRVIVDSLRTVAPMADGHKLMIPRKAYYKLWASAEFMEPGRHGVTLIVNGDAYRLAKGEQPYAEWRGYLNEGDGVYAGAYSDEAQAALTEIEFGLELLLD